MSTSSDLRTFGLVLAAFLVLLSLVGPHAIAAQRSACWLAAGASAGLALLVPRALVPVYQVWTRVGHGLGWVNTRLLLGIVFFLVVLPLGLARRAAGKGALPRHGDPRAASYRIPRTPDNDPARFERPY